MLGQYSPSDNPKTDLTVADILREHWAAYRAHHRVTPHQAKVVGSIMACRTPVLGGRLDQCQACGAWLFRFKSCRDRHCNQCQKYERAKWVEKQKVMVLPVPYFHVIFTVDHALNPLIRSNRKACYSLLFKTVSQVLQRQAKRVLGCELGITAVLHTWGQQLNEHYHLHCIVTGGGLALDGSRWVGSKSPRFLVDVKELSVAYRDALCAGLRNLYQTGQVSLSQRAGEQEVEQVLSQSQAKGWEVFSKPFSQPDTVIEYLSRYVHQVAISNHRLVKVEAGRVYFRYLENRERAEVGGKGRAKAMSLPVPEFIRRYLLHILPFGLQRIRYYGLHHSRARKEKLPRCRALLGLDRALPAVAELSLQAWLTGLLGDEVDRCPHCGTQGSLVERASFTQLPWLVILILSLGGQPARQTVCP